MSDTIERVKAELNEPGYSILRAWLALHGGMSAVIAVEEIAQLAERLHQQDAARIAALEAKAENAETMYHHATDERVALMGLLASHAETIRQLQNENEALRARVDRQRSLPPTGSTASTEGR